MAEIKDKLDEEVKELKELICRMVSALKHEAEKGIEMLDSKEAGEVADIIKDLSDAKKNIAQACYYESVVAAMEDYGDAPEDLLADELPALAKGYRGRSMTTGRFIRRPYSETDYHMPPDMYYGNTPEALRQADHANGQMYYQSGGAMPKTLARDAREGRSGMSRKGYMDSKNTADKGEHMAKLDKWMTDMQADVKELVGSMSAEEKNMAKTKIQNLAASL